MSNKVRVALDTMGGDFAPTELIKGAVAAMDKEPSLHIILVGQEDVILRELAALNADAKQFEIVPASEIITNDEAPVAAIRKKKDSSICVGLNLVRSKKADCFVSSGSTGAVLAGGLLIVGRIRGIQRTPLGALIPTKDGVCLLVDSGANVDVRPDHLLNFARLGSIYMEHVVGIKKPKIALLNIGVEEEKGNALVKETKPLMESCSEINYIGSIEAKDIPAGGADVIVCDGFAGNCVLKMYEGVGSTLLSLLKKSLMSSLRTKIGAALIMPSLKSTLKTFDASEYGGAPLLGLNGLVVKAHGSSKAKEICNALLQCKTFQEQQINVKIHSMLESDSQKSEQPEC